MWLIFLAGVIGAFVAEILNDNCLTLPKKIDGTLFLGSVGGLLIGGTAGILIDGQLETAFMGGFMGREVIVRLKEIIVEQVKKNIFAKLEKEKSQKVKPPDIAV